jgi:hypothetical protein
MFTSSSSEAFRSVKSGFFGVVSSSMFSMGFPFVAVVTASAEVMIREQDWREFNIDSAEAVYPVLLFFLTAFLFFASSVHLYRIGIARYSLYLRMSLTSGNLAGDVLQFMELLGRVYRSDV